MHKPVVLPLILAASLAWLLQSCSSGSTAPQALRAAAPQSAPAADTRGDLPALSALDSLRSGSELVETLIGGSFTLSRSAGAAEQGDALLLDASASGPGLGAVPEWAVYGFDPAAAGGSLDSLQVLLDSDATGAWVGLGDFSAERWEWHGPYSSFKSFLVDDAKYLSPGGTLFISVVSPAGVSSTVSALSVRTINPNNAAPTADLQADVTSGNAPLTVNFDASASSDPEGQALLYWWDWEGDGLFDASSISAQTSHSYSAGGSFTATLRVEDSSGAADNAQVQIEINSAPQAVLEIASDVLRKDELLHLSAGGSSDSDGSIVNYEWDSDGNGSFESSSGSSPDFSFYPALAGSLMLRLRVTDDAGASAVSTRAVWVSGYNLSQHNNGMPCGISSSVAVIGGKLALCYRDVSSAELRYSYALDDHCTSWSSPAVINTGEQGAQFNLLEVDGMPAVAWQGSPAINVCFCRATAADGSTWGSVQVLENNGFTGFSIDMDLIGGHPALVYLDKASNKLKFLRSDDAQGQIWNGPATIELLTDIQSCSLEEVNGRPALSYCLATTFDLIYERAEDSEGTDWSGPSLTLDASNVTGISCSLAVAGGKPAVAFYDADLDYLLYMRALDANGLSWADKQPVDTIQGSGKSLNMVVIGGRPVIGYSRGPSSDQLMVCQAADSQGISWEVPELVATGAAINNMEICSYLGQASMSMFASGSIFCAAGF